MLLNKRILWIVNGLGMGNSTRCHSIMEYLESKECITFNSLEGEKYEHFILTSGNGVDYFNALNESNKYVDFNISNIEEINGTHYNKDKDGKIDALDTIKDCFSQLKDFKAATSKINGIIDNFKPHLIITDSTYYNFKKTHAVHVAINNVDMIVSEFKGMSIFEKDALDAGVLNQYRFIEFFDYLYHRKVPDFVISPIFEELKIPIKEKKLTKNNVYHTKPFCRKEIFDYRNRNPKNKSYINVVIMFTGSGCGAEKKDHIMDVLNLFSAIREDIKGKINIDVIGNLIDDNDDRDSVHITDDLSVKFHGKIIHNEEIIKKSDLCIINAGFSAVGEMHNSNKIFASIPVDGHFEQYVNAKLSESFSNGVNSKEFSSYLLLDMCKRLRDDNFVVKKSTVNGSEEAAHILNDILKSRKNGLSYKK